VPTKQLKNIREFVAEVETVKCKILNVKVKSFSILTNPKLAEVSKACPHEKAKIQNIKYNVTQASNLRLQGF
jgi:hypothetical protein